MKLTAITGNLSQPALRKITCNAADPEYQPLKVRSKRSRNVLEVLSPTKRGDLFHQSSKAFFDGDCLPYGGCVLLPFICAIQQHLISKGYVTFHPEFELECGKVTGRADLIANGSRGRAVVEYKVTGMPWEPDAETMIQGASYGYMLPAQCLREQIALVLYYVDLRRARIESYYWKSYRDAAFRIRELRAV